MAFDAHNITPGAYTDTHATPKYTLGTISWANDGTAYRYVKAADIDLAVGYVVCYEAAQANGYVVTADKSSDESSLLAAGVALGTVDISEKPYCWVQVSGYCATVLGDASVAAGDFVVPDHTGAVDGVADTMADGEEEQVFGLALTDDDGSSHFDAILRGII
jgi:hypothetical protein